MAALQPRLVSGDAGDPFWEQNSVPDLDNFLQGLLSEPVDLNASLVPAALAVSFGLSTDYSATFLPPRAAAALLGRGGNSGPPRGGDGSGGGGGATARTGPAPAAPANQFHQHQMQLQHGLHQLQLQAAAQPHHPRRGLHHHSQQPTAGTVQGQQPGSGEADQVHDAVGPHRVPAMELRRAGAADE